VQCGLIKHGCHPESDSGTHPAEVLILSGSVAERRRAGLDDCSLGTWRAGRRCRSHGREPEETPEEVHASVVHTLGNLTLTAYNQVLSNSDLT
jgi:hypothetical protein